MTHCYFHDKLIELFIDLICGKRRLPKGRFKKLQPANIWHFCWLKQSVYNQWADLSLFTLWPQVRHQLIAFSEVRFFSSEMLKILLCLNSSSVALNSLNVLFSTLLKSTTCTECSRNNFVLPEYPGVDNKTDKSTFFIDLWHHRRWNQSQLSGTCQEMWWKEWRKHLQQLLFWWNPGGGRAEPSRASCLWRLSVSSTGSTGYLETHTHTVGRSLCIHTPSGRVEFWLLHTHEHTHWQTLHGSRFHQMSEGFVFKVQRTNTHTHTEWQQHFSFNSAIILFPFLSFPKHQYDQSELLSGCWNVANKGGVFSLSAETEIDGIVVRSCVLNCPVNKQRTRRYCSRSLKLWWWNRERSHQEVEIPVQKPVADS